MNNTTVRVVTGLTPVLATGPDGESIVVGVVEEFSVIDFATGEVVATGESL